MSYFVDEKGKTEFSSPKIAEVSMCVCVYIPVKLHGHYSLNFI